MYEPAFQHSERRRFSTLRDEKRVKAWTAEEFLNRHLPEKESLAEGLIHKRDLVALAARRRHGKTTFLINLGIAGALGEPEFIGYKISQPFRTLLFMLEDDPRELQAKLKGMVGEKKDGLERLMLVTRDDFHQADIPIISKEEKFKETVKKLATEHKPDVIVFDNLSHIVAAEYSDPKTIDDLMKFAYDLARTFNAAVIFAAHPKKQDINNSVTLEDSPEAFSEQIMGSSHFINSTGSIWALEKRDEYSLFVGGRQRGDGYWQQCVLHLDEKQRFQLVPDVNLQLEWVLNTPSRQKAWGLLPDPPKAFGYREAQAKVKSALSSSSSFSNWFRELKRVRAIEPKNDGKNDKWIKVSQQVSPKAQLFEAIESI